MSKVELSASNLPPSDGKWTTSIMIGGRLLGDHLTLVPSYPGRRDPLVSSQISPPLAFDASRFGHFKVEASLLVSFPSRFEQ
jgi:hypothetical protein